MENADEFILSVDVYSNNFKINKSLLNDNSSLVCSNCNKLLPIDDFKDGNIKTTLWGSDKPCCFNCYEEEITVKKFSEKYGSELIEITKDRLCTIRSNCKVINREFSITLLDVISLYDKQEGKCAISGLPLTLYSKLGAYSTGISIDRIDSTKGYRIDNIQLVCLIVNTMKTAMTMDEFLNICKIITENNCKLKNKLLSL